MKARFFMTVIQAKKTGIKSRFSFCPQCGRKGLYYINRQYYRCRYCGAYMIPPPEKNNG